MSMAGKQWVLPWDGARPYGWEDRPLFLLHRKVPRMVRVYLTAWFYMDRVEIKRGMGFPGVSERPEFDVVGHLTDHGLYVHDCPSQGPDPERLCLRVVDLTFREQEGRLENHLAEWRALKNHPFWTEFLRDVRDMWTVAEVMLS